MYGLLYGCAWPIPNNKSHRFCSRCQVVDRKTFSWRVRLVFFFHFLWIFSSFHTFARSAKSWGEFFPNIHNKFESVAVHVSAWRMGYTKIFDRQNQPLTKRKQQQKTRKIHSKVLKIVNKTCNEAFNGHCVLVSCCWLCFEQITNNFTSFGC